MFPLISYNFDNECFPLSLLVFREKYADHLIRLTLYISYIRYHYDLFNAIRYQKNFLPFGIMYCIYPCVILNNCIVHIRTYRYYKTCVIHPLYVPLYIFHWENVLEITMREQAVRIPNLYFSTKRSKILHPSLSFKVSDFLVRISWIKFF